MTREPRNVKGYHVQTPPDGCHNCGNQYNGMVRCPGNQPVLSCKLACLTPEQPSFCDEVDPMGKCDSWIAGEGANEAIERELAEQDGFLPPDLVVAMTIWGEARGESFEGKRAVASVIRWRAAAHERRTGYPLLVSASRVCLSPHQFSCWSKGKFVQQEPDMDSKAWAECAAAAAEIFHESYVPPITATHYHAVSAHVRPGWADSMEYVGKIGNHLFYFETGWRG